MVIIEAFNATNVTYAVVILSPVNCPHPRYGQPILKANRHTLN